MSSRRVQKAAQAIREVVSMAILAEIKDPRVRDVTVTHVEVAGDMRSAKIFVSIMGNESKQNLALQGLRSASGFLQSKVASRIETRYTPRLEIVLDQGVKKSIAIAEILHRVLPKEDSPRTAAISHDDETPREPGDTQLGEADMVDAAPGDEDEEEDDDADDMDDSDESNIDISDTDDGDIEDGEDHFRPSKNKPH
jgi:ribosome-binding factor A